MRLIAHRGNIDGQMDDATENNPRHIDQTVLRQGFDVEVDIWAFGEESFYLGHNEPYHHVSIDWLNDRRHKLWLHAKNLNALKIFSQPSDNMFNVFWHENDDFTLTSMGFIWTNIGKPVTPKSVLVDLNLSSLKNLGSEPYGLCTDFAIRLKEIA